MQTFVIEYQSQLNSGKEINDFLVVIDISEDKIDIVKEHEAAYKALMHMLNLDNSHFDKKIDDFKYFDGSNNITGNIYYGHELFVLETKIVESIKL